MPNPLTDMGRTAKVTSTSVITAISSNAVEEIGQAIDKLTPAELENCIRGSTGTTRSLLMHA
jgi:hypothetical protein